jgi:hypothetical protein
MVSVTVYRRYSFDRDMDLKDNPVCGLRLGNDLTERWGLEGALDYVKTKLDQANGDAVTVYGYRFDALFHFMLRAYHHLGCCL